MLRDATRATGAAILVLVGLGCGAAGLFSLGLWLAGAAGAVALLPGVALTIGCFGLMRIASQLGEDAHPASSQRKCPDCAEFVLAEARVCRFCGHRFEALPAAAA